jgi:hypothetical protein
MLWFCAASRKDNKDSEWINTEKPTNEWVGKVINDSIRNQHLRQLLYPFAIKPLLQMPAQLGWSSSQLRMRSRRKRWGAAE